MFFAFAEFQRAVEPTYTSVTLVNHPILYAINEVEVNVSKESYSKF